MTAWALMGRAGSALGALWGLALQGLRALVGAGGRLLRLALGLGRRAAVGFAELVLRGAAALRAGWTAIGGLAGLIRYARGGAKWGLRQLGKGAAAFSRLVFGGIRKAPALGWGLLAGLGLGAVHWASRGGVPSKREKEIKEWVDHIGNTVTYNADRYMYLYEVGEELSKHPNPPPLRTARGISGFFARLTMAFAQWFWHGKVQPNNWADAAQDTYDGVDLALNAKAVWGMRKAINFAKTPVSRFVPGLNVIFGIVGTVSGLWDMSMDIRTMWHAPDDHDQERGEAAFDLVRHFGKTLGGIGLTLGGLAALGFLGVGAPVVIGLAVGGLAVWGVATAVKWWDRRYNGGRLAESVGRGIKNGIAWVKSLPDRAVQTWRAVREAPGRVWRLVEQKVWEAAKDAGREAARRGIRWMTDKVKKFFQPKPTAK